MSTTFDAVNGKTSVPDILSRKSGSSSSLGPRKIVCLASYDYRTACLLDDAGVDIVLVGDSLGMVLLGSENTLSATVDETVHHSRAGGRRDSGHGPHRLDATIGSRFRRLPRAGGRRSMQRSSFFATHAPWRPGAHSRSCWSPFRVN